MYAGMYPTRTYTHTHTHANGCMHASAFKQTDRRTDACAHAECMTSFIPTDRHVHGGLPAHTHAQMHTYVRTYIIHTHLLFVWFDSLHFGQQFFSYVGRTDLPGLNQYKARINGSSSMTHRSDACEARTRGTSVSSQALYHWATALH